MQALLDRPLSDRAASVSLSVAWVLVALIANPVAELPLNDDWAYSLPVKSWVEQGDLRLTFWQSMPLLPQLGWGALFCLPFGFSFTALRVSTLVLGGLGVGLAFRLLRERGVAAPVALLGASCLLAQPVYVALSHTFMTDVPFVTLLLASSLFLMRALDSGRTTPLVVGTLLAVLATLVRQVGLILPLAFAVAGSARWGLRRSTLWRVLPPLLIVGASLPLSRGWIDRHLGLPALYDTRDAGLREALLDLAHLHLGVLRLPLERTAFLFLHLGLSLLPLLLVLLAARARTHRGVLLAALGMGVLFAGGLLVLGVRFPREDVGNIWLGLAVGPRTLPGAPPALPAAVLLVITVLASLGAGALAALVGDALGRAARDFRSGPRSVHALFLLALMVIGFAPFALAYGAHFDRYALFMVPLVPGLLLLRDVPVVSRRLLGPAFAWVLLVALFSAAATHDYLAGQRAVWALAEAHQRSQPDVPIEAGFEYDNYQQQHAEMFAGAPRTNALADRAAAPFAVAYAAPEGARVIARRTTGAWLPFAPREVVVFARQR